jgi:threonine aldolase
MAEAEVGDDAYGEDPSVNALQEAFAELVGKAAALLVPSGTMANQIALRVLAGPGTSVLAGRRQHIVLYEGGAAGLNTACQLELLDDDEGSISPSDVSRAIEAHEHHQPLPSMVCVENTHMAAGGVPWSLEDLDALYEAARGLPVHIDGARLFNASVSTSIPPKRLARGCSTVMSCLSKGLCAPVGSLIAGPAEVMERARVARRQLGGGMRQAGVIAAAGLVALRTMVERLAEDHARARRLAEAVADRWPGSCEPEKLRTNIVVFGHRSPPRLIEHLASEGVLAGTIAPGVVRLVTHHDVDDACVERALEAIATAP